MSQESGVNIQRPPTLTLSPAGRENSYGDAAAELSAALSDVAVFDVSDRVQIEIAGRDRQTFLHNFCSNDIKKLQPDQGCEAFVTNIKGKVVGHIFVFAETEALWLESILTCQAIA